MKIVFSSSLNFTFFDFVLSVSGLLFVSDAMKNPCLSLIALSFLFFFADAHAGVTCPPGTYSVGGSHEVDNYSYCAPFPEDEEEEDWSAWGAIAVGDTGFGYGVDYSTEDDAMASAVAGCSEHSSSCRVVATFSNQCGALAWGDSSYGNWVSPNLAEAERSALYECSKYGLGCQVVFSKCN